MALPWEAAERLLLAEPNGRRPAAAAAAHISPAHISPVLPHPGGGRTHPKLLSFGGGLVALKTSELC